MSTLNRFSIPEVKEATQYRAIGLLRGRYIPSQENLFRGEIVLELEGVERRFFAGIAAQCRGYYGSKQVNIDPQQDYDMLVWVRSFANGNHGFTIIGFQEVSTANSQGLNQFSIRGEVADCDSGMVKLKIKRNVSVDKGDRKKFENKPFLVKIKGKLGQVQKGQFWSLNVELDSQGNLQINKADFVRSAREKTSKTKANKKTRTDKRATRVRPSKAITISRKPLVAKLATQKVS